MLRGLLALALVALAVAAATTVSAPAQSLVGREAGGTIRAANALSARIRAYHRGPASWRGTTPVPPGYCGTMREGEAVVKELSRLASRAVLYRLPGLALELQAAGNRLSDELDEEEIINQAADIPYTVYPCPVEGRPYPARATVLYLVEARMPTCRAQGGCAAGVVRRAPHPHPAVPARLKRRAARVACARVATLRCRERHSGTPVRWSALPVRRRRTDIESGGRRGGLGRL